jgi:serine/threonine-protein kinase HipA
MITSPNFSLINRGEGYQLAPVYDLVPSLAAGEYHAAGYAFKPYPPRPSVAANLGKVFGLPRTVVADAAEQVSDAIKNWPGFAEQCGVTDEDSARIARCFQP